ncbi:CHAT domain-containing protein [Paraburkholderia unamae]|uniref:CHAT domain-containing protein n=2 Tax=Paraburkholderia unamae TaxID=219649 RepID=UPI000DC4DC77|nr:CHAT domain-containing protein [Paraburkholderia unamae]RAR48847.1 CHAT domain-containing protein [Paraburkholderia unamae]
MPIRNIPGSDIAYYLILFDENGRERAEADGTMLSAAVMARLAAADDPVTDVFVCSHGWQGDVPAAIDQYDRWIGAMAQCEADLAAMEARNPAFNPMVIGVHWPSLPWGMETVPASAAGAASPAGVLSTGADAASHDAIDMLAGQLGADADTRGALQRIFAFADIASDTNLPGHVLADFETLFTASKLRTGSAAGRPGADQDGFDPQAIVDAVAPQAATAAVPGGAGAGAAAPHVLGIVGALKDAVLAPLRQLSFWKMKDRARTFGEGGAHALLGAMQNASANARFHLMGHSFGCIVVSGMVAGETTTGTETPIPALHRPIDSLFLVQGALSLWSFAADVPFAPGTPGYFSRILDGALVCGPLLTTQSSWDTAVGKFYPLGAAAKGQFLLGADAFPKYGGVGAFGIQGAPETVALTLGAIDARYDFSDAHVFNFDASGVIRNGSGPAGAHSDIAHPEVAHAFWSAALEGASADGAAAAAAKPTAPPAAHPPLGALPPRRGLLDIEDTLPSPAGVADVQRGGLLDIADAPPADMAADGAASSGAAAPAAPAASPPPPPPPPAAMAAAPGSAPAPAATSRWINAEFEDMEPADPLVKGQWHTLAFGVDVTAHHDAPVSVPFAERGVFGPDDATVVLTVQIDTDDFDISGKTGLMRIPPTGKGYSKARFDIAPRKDGPCALKATILKDGQFIQQIDLVFEVGSAAAPAVQVATRGRGLDGLAVLQPRDLSLQIYPGAAGDYECVLCGAVATHVRLPVNAALIDAYIRSARDSLMKVVMYRDAGGNYVFQSGIDATQDALDKALPIMADAGALLLSTLFYGPGAGDDVRAVGNALRQLGTRADLRLKIQIVAQTLPVPWPLLYLGDVSGDVPYSWDNFLGMRHIIEQIPLQNPMAVTEPEITSTPSLNVSLNFHAGIDAQMGVDVVASQRAFWQGRAGTTIEDRESGDDFIKALRQAQTPDQILYLYCHAVSKGLTDPGGPGASCIELTDRLVSLNDLKLRAPTDTRLAGKPLVFINACESAEMSSTFYDGFAPYFMDKGARGVIGTECKTPALFAKAWANRFFEEFLAGKALGNVMLGLRDEFLKAHFNPLGLLYAVHCDADTRIDPALQASKAAPAAAAEGAAAQRPGDASASAAGAAG